MGIAHYIPSIFPGIIAYIIAALIIPHRPIEQTYWEDETPKEE